MCHSFFSGKLTTSEKKLIIILKTYSSSFTCLCNIGFEGNGHSCKEIDECEIQVDNCSGNATCINTVGSFDCECNIGFFGNGIECVRDINECYEDNGGCGENSLCYNTGGSFMCVCINGYVMVENQCRSIDNCLKVNMFDFYSRILLEVFCNMNSTNFVTMLTYWFPDLSNIKGNSGHVWSSILIFANGASYT